MAARLSGKLKTLVQNVAIGALLFPDPTLGLPAHAIGLTLLAVATLLTLWSGWELFRRLPDGAPGGDRMTRLTNCRPGSTRGRPASA